MKWYPGPSASVFNPVPIEDTFSTAVDLAHFPPGAKPITAAGFTLNSPLHDPAFAIHVVYSYCFKVVLLNLIREELQLARHEGLAPSFVASSSEPITEKVKH